MFTVWYRWLDSRLPGSRRLLLKLSLDQFVFAPPLLALFFITMSWLEGEKDVFDELKKKFIPAFAAECAFWLPAQALNFKLVPAGMRVLYMGLCSFLWLNVLCVIKSWEKYAEAIE